MILGPDQKGRSWNQLLSWAICLQKAYRTLDHIIYRYDVSSKPCSGARAFECACLHHAREQELPKGGLVLEARGIPSKKTGWHEQREAVSPLLCVKPAALPPLSPSGKQWLCAGTVRLSSLTTDLFIYFFYQGPFW